MQKLPWPICPSSWLRLDLSFFAAEQVTAHALICWARSPFTPQSSNYKPVIDLLLPYQGRVGGGKRTNTVGIVRAPI